MTDGICKLFNSQNEMKRNVFFLLYNKKKGKQGTRTTSTGDEND